MSIARSLLMSLMSDDDKMVYTDGIHLVGNNVRFLHIFAESIGLGKHWFDRKGRGPRKRKPTHPHYDLFSKPGKQRAEMLKKALVCGAVMISTREMVAMMAKRREESKARAHELWERSIGLYRRAQDPVITPEVRNNIRLSFERPLHFPGTRVLNHPDDRRILDEQYIRDRLKELKGASVWLLTEEGSKIGPFAIESFFKQ